MRWETLLLIFKTMHSRLTPHKAERIFSWQKKTNYDNNHHNFYKFMRICFCIRNRRSVDSNVLLTSNCISQSCRCLEFRVLYAGKIINSKGEKINYVMWFFKVQSDQISTRASILFKNTNVKLDRIGYRTGWSFHNLLWLYGSFDYD